MTDTMKKIYTEDYDVETMMMEIWECDSELKDYEDMRGLNEEVIGERVSELKRKLVAIENDMKEIVSGSSGDLIQVDDDSVIVVLDGSWLYNGKVYDNVIHLMQVL